jgi:hypothetical protein
MIVIPPVDLTIVSSSETEPVAGDGTAWVTGTSYTQGTVVYLASNHKTYYCIANGTSTQSPDLNIYANVPMWTEYGYTNKYTLLDLFRNKSTTATTTYSVVCSTTRRFDTVAIYKATASTLTVAISNATSGTFYTKSVTSLNNETVLCEDIPPYYNCTITVTASGPSIAISGLTAGLAEFMGYIQKNTVLDSNNYSVVTRDIYGNVTLNRRRNVPKITCTTMCQAELIGRVSEVRDDINAKPVLWIGLEDQPNSNYYQPLILKGFYRSFKISLEEIMATISLELEEV